MCDGNVLRRTLGRSWLWETDWMHHSAELRFLTPSTPSSTAANLTTAETGTDLDTKGKTSICFLLLGLWPLSRFPFLSIKISCSQNNPCTFYFSFWIQTTKGPLLFIGVLFWGCCSFLFRLCVTERIISKLSCLKIISFWIILHSFKDLKASFCSLLCKSRVSNDPILSLFFFLPPMQPFSFLTQDIRWSKKKKITWSWPLLLTWPDLT